nr:tetraspanin-2-like [Ipomoea batatas]
MASSLSNKITAFLNFVAVMCSIPVISAGIWLASNSDNQDHVTGDDYWADIRACLAADRDICPAMSNNYFTAELFFAARLSPLQTLIVPSGTMTQPNCVTIAILAKLGYWEIFEVNGGR